MEILVKRTTYRHWKNFREIFDLELVFNEGLNQLFLSSTVIPDWILEKAFFNWEELMENPPKFDQEKVTRVLAQVAKEIVKHPCADRFFFPKSWLNKKGQVTNQYLGKYDTAKNNIKMFDIRFITKRCELEGFYLATIMHKAINGALPSHILNHEIITRKEWETNLEYQHHIEAYLELYKEAKSFIQVNSRGLDPSFSAGLNNKGEIVIAFITHSKVINE